MALCRTTIILHMHNWCLGIACDVGFADVHHLHLAGYGRHQYSDYRHPNSNPVAVWIVMVQLCQIQPSSQCYLA